MANDEVLETDLDETDQTVYEVGYSVYTACRRFGTVQEEYSEKLREIAEELSPVVTSLDERIELIRRLVENEIHNPYGIPRRNDPNYKLINSMRGLRNVLNSGDLDSVQVYETGIWFSPAYDFVHYWTISSTEEELREIVRVQADIDRAQRGFFDKKNKIIELEQKLERLEDNLEKKYR